MTLSAPFSYVKHLNFLNFEEFNQTNPIYINMVSYDWGFRNIHPTILGPRITEYTFSYIAFLTGPLNYHN